ncbi:MAG: sigma-E processing peptidase SpoIIGA [Epulopiscium sp.]|nr:sigma-E processing peptidase SpoIIGA [Candidatus Epulonipiscium sp.]
MSPSFEIEIYIDIVFFLNFIMDYFIMWIVSKIIKEKVTNKRLIFGAFLASLLYCLIFFIPVFKKTYNIIGLIILPMIPLMITYKAKTFRKLIKVFILFHITAFALGGAGIALFYYLNIGKFIKNSLRFNIDNFPILLLIVSSLVSYFIIKLILIWIRKFSNNAGMLYQIKIYYEGMIIDACALMDTGNSLYDPFSQSPVIVVEFSSIKRFLPDSIQQLFNENKENDLSLLIKQITGCQIRSKIRVIPFSSLGTPNGMLLGFKPDQVEILEKDDTIKVLQDVVIGIYNQRLSRDNKYQALLHPDIFHEIA